MASASNAMSGRVDNELRELEDALAQAGIRLVSAISEQEKLEVDLENERRARVAAESQVLTPKTRAGRGLYTRLGKIGQRAFWHSLLRSMTALSRLAGARL